MTQLAPKLRLFDFTMIVISLVIGMGIFRTPAIVADKSPSLLIFFAAWIAGGLVALCGALTYAEIGSRFPVTGAYYKIFSYAYHPSIAFGVNCVILVSNAASLAGVAIIGGEYITGVFIPEIRDPAYMAVNGDYVTRIHMGIAIAAIIIFYGVNLLGLKMSARAQSILMMIKIVMILLLITPLFISSDAPVIASLDKAISPTMNQYLLAFGTGLVAVSFTYGGYQQTINFGAEVNNPNRNIPRGIFFGIFVIIALYLTINYAYIKVIGFEQLKDSKNIAGIMASKVFGANAERILSGFLFLSVLAYVNVLLMSNPRVMYAMSEDGILPATFQKRSTKNGALVVSLSVFAALCALIVFWSKKFETILNFSIFLDCFGMILSAGSIFILRKRTAHLDGTGIYKMKLYPLLPIIFILAYTLVAISIFVDETKLALIALGVLAGFIAIYFIFMNNKRREDGPVIHNK